MANFLKTIVETKKAEVKSAKTRLPESEMRQKAMDSGAKRPFEAVLRKPGPKGVNIIAEIKRASPSKGAICPNLEPAVYAAMYERAGAAAISVLTDETYFQGSLNDLVAARNAVAIPVLRKEFIISTYQIYEAAAAGADAVLLIARILEPAQLKDYLSLCRTLGLAALVEIHAREEIDAAVKADARLIGINNRDLSSFETNISIASRMAGLLSPMQVPVAASGITCAEDIQNLKASGIFNFLIGECIVRAKDPENFLQSLFPWREKGE